MNKPRLHPPRAATLRGLARALALALAATGLLWPALAAQPVIQPGEAAPPFSLPDLAGKTRSLAADTSGTTLLVFLKPDEKFTTDTLGAVDHMVSKVPEFRSQLRRFIVVSRYDTLVQVRKVAEDMGPRAVDWPILADEGDKLYKAYRIIATPTLVAVGGGKVKAVHPGYDTGLEDSFRRELAAAMGIKLPESMTQPPEKPNMNLQMGRRLAERGLWDRALEYYVKAQAAGPIGDAAQVEMARLLIEIGKYDEAIAMLTRIPAASPAAKDAAAALEKARALQAGRSGPTPTPMPPKVTK